ncbi:hypothetical protein HJC23_005794 [Cyclotella cryptica]|uniref:Orc1-like AAA ATPase domain-containing protein n=1 Tax=Cyclotella cryptica TaxID=29204 RepID=A0ABD3P8K5_9STRA|eukprot:CCRYP_016763-RA/>CCRYP_016763-RA protein AED:0.02 eAED:0.02 QI:416/1/0.66/1/1/1/3/18/1407
MNSSLMQSPTSDRSSLSPSASSKSSSHYDINPFLDTMCKPEDSDASKNVIDGSRQHHRETESKAAAGCYDPRNLTQETTAGLHKGRANPVNAQEEIQEVNVMPLKSWNRDEESKTRHFDLNCQRKLQEASMMRKITIGFGIGKLLHHLSQQNEPPLSKYSPAELQSLGSIDNFAVEFINEAMLSESGIEVMRVHMIRPFISAHIDTFCSSSSWSSFDIENENRLSDRNVVATIMSPFPSVCVNTIAEEKSHCDSTLCHLLGVLLHFLFTENRREQKSGSGLLHDDRDYDSSIIVDGSSMKEKKSIDWFQCDMHGGLSYETVDAGKDSYPHVRCADFSDGTSLIKDGDMPIYSHDNDGSLVNLTLSPLMDFGYPPSLSQLVTNLVDCGLGLREPDAYTSSDEAINDMHIMLQEPRLFLSFGPPPAVNTFMGSEKLYGRSNEIASLTAAYSRVATSGTTEAIFVGGFSGCGKTRLVHSTLESVNIAGGYTVAQKFDEMQSSSPVTVVLSAFNELCIMVAQKCSETCLMTIYEKLSSVIGTTNLTFLTRILPNVRKLLPSHVTLPYLDSQVQTDFNILCYSIQHLMKVISTPSRTVILFLDDLQRADATSLKLLHCVLSDVRDLNSLLFVGGYRENEVEQGHVLLEFFDALLASEVVSSMIHLNGISPSDVNSMISDTLGVFPRLCKGLSDVLFHKTNGNPFFTWEFLRSLITRDLVQYSLQDKCWKWNLRQIMAENITDNVLHLLTRKMNVLSESDQRALKVASCFGNIISIDIVKKLSCTSQYSSLLTTLDETALTEGFMDRDDTSYRFVHDKVREVAYGLIVDKQQYHFDVGVALQSVGGAISAAANQINRGSMSLLQDNSRRISIVNLNYEASMKPMDCSDFTAAYSYLNTAVSLLPNDSWTAHYDLTLKCCFQLAKAAYSCGQAKRAQQICEEIIEHAKCLEVTLETYSLLVSTICLANKDLLIAFKMCLKVLNMVGENIPDDVVDINSTVKKVKMLFQNTSNEDLLSMVDERSSRKISIMEFYNHLVTVSFLVKPQRICHYYVARWASFCLTQCDKCQYTPGAFVSFASMLSRDLDEDTRLACRISNAGMTMLSRNDSAMIKQLPAVYSVHYMGIGSLTEPIQSVVEMNYHAYEIGMQNGNLSHAAVSLSIMMATSLYAGTSLSKLKNDLEVHLTSANKHSQLNLLANLVIIHEVVSKLIGDEEAKSFPDLEQHPLPNEDLRHSLDMFSSFYLGHAERVHYKSKLWEKIEDDEKRKVPIRFICTAFLSGMASFRLYSYGRKDSQIHIKNLEKSLSILEKASAFSEWNYKNKYLLLNAANLSIADTKLNAENEFDAAILDSKSSKFVHEEGLACELAAMHHVKHGNNALALTLLHQAKSCYKRWGCRVKEVHIASHINAIQNKST